MGSFLKKFYPYLVGLAAVGVAFLIRGELLAPLLGDRVPFGIFTLAVLCAAWVGGLWPGLLATVLSVAAGWFGFASASASVSNVATLMTAIFVVNCVLISIVCESFHRNRRRVGSAQLLAAESAGQLKRNEERQRAILNAIPHIVWTTDKDGMPVYANDRFASQLVKVALDGEMWKRIIHESDLATFVQRWDDVRNAGTPVVQEARLQMADGTYRWHLFHIEPSRLSTGEVDGWFLTATDVDETYRSAEELRRSEGRFRHLADSAPILIWMTDADKSFSWFNQPWLDFTGKTLEQETGEGWMANIHPDDLQRYRQAFEGSFAARLEFEVDFRLLTKGGGYRWVLMRGIPLYGSNEVFLGYLGGGIDIHERKEAEENSEHLLRIEQDARIEAERTAVLKDEFLATVSHEMRTPLTAMLGWVQLLRSGSLPSDTVPQALETIERNARAQAKLIDDLLDMSRILSGRLRLDLQQVNIRETVEAAVAAAEPGAAAKKIQLVRVLDPRTGPVLGDPTRLQQVIWNLLSNAIKFTPSNGEITVSLERVNSHLEISVSDTGEGIAPEFLPHVFDRFRQQDASTMRKHQGLGLGLSIVKQLVELHGGTVRAKSPGPGEGATFIVALPIAAANTTTTEKSRQEPADSESSNEPVPTLLGTRVLVVDDDADARELLRSILAQSGASVRTASSVDDALRQFDDRAPNVLVSDIGMPGEDGYELIKRIRRREDGEEVPALALTAFARSDDRRRAINAGFHMHLAKPVEPAELITVVASLAKRSNQS